MVLAVRNFTPYRHQTLPLTARNGAMMLRVVVKAGFDIAPGGGLTLCPRQPDIVLEDEYWGEPVRSALRCESEVILGKPMTDLLVNGQACAPCGGPVTEMEVALSYQQRVIKRLRVTGDRQWWRGPLGWHMDRPRPFTSMPVSFDRAFGGSDAQGAEPRNPVGRGHATHPGSHFEGMPAPNIEHPDQLIDSVHDRPEPAGLGVVARHWEPRKRHAGTYDAAWLDHRFPLLPDDFDERFFQTAPTDQWIEPPQGGERIDVLGMTPRQDRLLFQLPPCRLHMHLRYEDREAEPPLRLETVLVEPTARRLVLTWGGSADIHGDPFKLLDIEIWPDTEPYRVEKPGTRKSEATPPEPEPEPEPDAQAQAQAENAATFSFRN